MTGFFVFKLQLIKVCQQLRTILSLLRALRSLAKQSPDNSSTCFNLGDCFVPGDDEAFVIEEARRCKPYNFKVQLLKSTSLRALRSLAKQSPDNSSTCFNLGDRFVPRDDEDGYSLRNSEILQTLLTYASITTLFFRRLITRIICRITASRISVNPT